MKAKLHKGTTFSKYFLSYILILAVSLTGLYFIVNFQLKQEFEKTYSIPDEIRLENLVSIISQQFSNINKTNISIESDINLINSRYSSNDYMQYEAVLELKKSIAGNTLIRDVIYLNRNSKKAISSNIRVSEGNGNIYVQSRNGNEFLAIPYDSILSSQEYSCTLKISGATDSIYLYVPPQTSNKYACFYLLNETELKTLISMCISPSLTSVALVNSDFIPLSSINEEPLSKYLSEIKNNPKAQQNYGDSIVYVISTSFKSLHLVALSDNSFARNSVNAVFRNTYAVMLLIALLGIIVTLLSMRMTYFPLHKLTKRITGNANTNTEDLKSISRVFDDTCIKNEELLQKIDNYRLTIQKTIIGSIVSESNAGSPELMDHIDDFFSSNNQNCFFVAKLFLEPPANEKESLSSIQSRLPPNGICVLMERYPSGISLLLNLPGPETPDDDSILSLFTDVLQKPDCRISVSDCSENAMDIARLYDNASLAVKFLENQKFIFYNTVKDRVSAKKNLFYPYKIFDNLVENLSDLDFDLAQNTVNELFDTIDMQNSPEFFVRCILLDIVTLIVSSMNNNNISFGKYSEVYYETLFLCRSSDYRETEQHIIIHIKKIISIFSVEILNSSIHILQVQKFIKDNCMSCNFSVAVLAENFHVNIAYMSYIFKKKANMNLTDYIWKLRLERAEKLLTDSDLPIDQISTMVGYENSSSFRRKFKESVHMTPSSYRDRNKK